MSKLNQIGDTIVEVLVVIVVLSVVLISAYGIAVRSLQDTQTTQERAYALKVAEGQLERLRALAASGDPNDVLNKTEGFCLDSNLVATDLPSGTPAATPDTDVLTAYAAACHQDPNDLANTCNTYCYYVSIKRVSIPSTNPDEHAYTASVRWDSARGNHQQVQLSYKVYKQ